MGSKREEERNEKIIRGLMKLPPNRRCLNCNTLVPQYVCTDFWTFVCTTCSGIHREFTHRVKSVSMAKFTSQEVDALQRGGNQRARELFLKAWDPLKRLPDNSNIEKLRQFIKNVYVEKIYSVEKSLDHSSIDVQGIRSPEDQSQRASSYHSYSQSPPYDFQYEERRYGKNAFGLSKNPGSDHGRYDDPFPNDGSLTRVSDYSFSGGSPRGETSRHSPGDALQLPRGAQDVDRSSRRNSGRIFHPQRASSFGGFASFDSSSMSLKSLNSLGLSESGSAHEQSSEFLHDRSSSSQNCSFPRTLDGSDTTGSPFATEDFSLIQFEASDINFSQPPLAGTATSAQKCPTSNVPAYTTQHPSEGQQLSSLNLFPTEPQQQLLASSIAETSDMIMPNTHGWAMLDLPENLMSMRKEESSISPVPFLGGNVVENTNPFAIEKNSSYQDSMKHDHSTLVYGFEHEDGHNVMTSDNTGFKNDSSIRSAEVGEPTSSDLSSNLFVEINLPVASSLVGVYSLPHNHQPSNPFDLPDDSLIEMGSMIWGIGSLQATLPNKQTPTSFFGEADHFWFPEGSVPSYAPIGVPFDPPNGPLGHTAGQAPTTQIPFKNIQLQLQSQPLGPLAATSGNPFA